MKIDVDLPKFDIPKDFIVGDGIMGDILNMYGLFPCKIKAGVFAFCTRGTIRVTINLDEHTARANDFITLLPNTFIQIHEVSEDAEVCFVAFSSRFLESINFIRTISNLIVTIIENPVVPLSGNAAAIYKDFFSLLVRADNAPDSILFTDSLKPVLDLLIQGVVNMYRRFNTWKEPVLSRDKEIGDKEFKSKMMNLIREDACGSNTMCGGTIIRIDGSGYSGYSYMDNHAVSGRVAVETHSKGKSAFYSKKIDKKRQNERLLQRKRDMERTAKAAADRHDARVRIAKADKSFSSIADLLKTRIASTPSATLETFLPAGTDMPFFDL